MKMKYQKKIKHQADKILYKQEKRNGQQQQIRQQQKRNGEIHSAYKVRQIEEASFYSHLENLKDLVSTEAKKEVPVLSIIKETKNDQGCSQTK